MGSSAPVRALAAQAHTELTRRASDVRESAEQLSAIAGRFEQVDLETVAGMEAWLENAGLG
jgi:hypothetical protein